MELERLVLETSDARAEVLPSLGALVTRFAVGERDILYCDDASLRTDKRRGGVPVLFPAPGRLKNDLFEAQGRYGKLPHHGFARDLPFRVAEKTAASVVLELEGTDATLGRFPWDFLLRLRVELSATCLTYTIDVESRDEEPMPFAFGLHPYFSVRDKNAMRVTTPATRAFDNRTKRHVAVPSPIDFAHEEVDLHLVDHGAPALRFDTGAGAVTLSGSDEFRTWVLWTLPERPFVCVEPWTSPGNALNTGTDLLELAPGAARRLSLSIQTA